MTDRLYYSSSMARWSVVGLTSLVDGRGKIGPRGRHVLLADYDGKDIDLVRVSARYAQERLGLGSCFVFETRKGYHLVWLDAQPFRDVAWCLSRLPVESKDHAVMGAANGFWTLRATGKGPSRVRFAEVLAHEGRYPLSRSHGEFLRLWYGIPPGLLGNGRRVGGRRCVVARYQTLRRQPL